MLQRAASNAYSGWWAGHIRTKQSKWLEQSLQDMEEKVQHMLTLIEEDGDSFAKRAEMYYKRRPELINFVEESYRAYKALADRYDHMSTELQNANNTLASVFPEQVQFAMDDEDDYGTPRIPKTFSKVPSMNVPAVPKAPSKDLKAPVASSSPKVLQPPREPLKRSSTGTAVVKSGLSRSEALEEIDRLQKETLALQTVKEFVKSSYENGLAKYWEIEKQITEKQDRVFNLQDEFDVGKVIEDGEARSLMAEAALKSCQETLALLQERQERSTMEAKEEHKRIEDARQKLNSLMEELLPRQQQSEYDEAAKVEEKLQSPIKQVDGVGRERHEMEALQEKIKEHFDASSKATLTMGEVADKIDELVNKVISLENAVSSQTALIDTLRTETDELQGQIRSLENDKSTLINDTNNLTNRLRELEAKLNGIQDLNQNVGYQNNNLQIHFTEARFSLDHLSHKLLNVNAEETKLEATDMLQEEDDPLVEANLPEEFEKQDKWTPANDFMSSRDVTTEVAQDKKEQVVPSASLTSQEEEEEEEEKCVQSCTNSVKCVALKSVYEVDKQELSQTSNDLPDTGKEMDFNWQQMLLDGLEDREKILLTEYKTVLRNYKDIKKKLSEVEKENRDSMFEMTVKLREMSSAVAKRDEEIKSLSQKLKLLQEISNESEELSKDDDQSTSDLLNDRSGEPEETTKKPNTTEVSAAPRAKKEEEDVKLIFVDEPQGISPIEEKLQMNIDAILDENLDFWLRFSTSFHQMQKFKTEVQDLQDEISKLKEKEKMKQEASTKVDLKSEARPIYKHLREIQTELTVWLEASAVLKDELQRRLSSLCCIEEEIEEALNADAEGGDTKKTTYQAAKFEGEVLNMKQENKKIRDELETNLDHATALQLEIEKTLVKLNDEYEISGSKNQSQSQLARSTTRSRVPLQSFIFGDKPKKQKNSIFSCMNPAFHKKYHNIKAAFPL